MKNKTILITGATSGIGYATALAFSKLGANLILCGRREEKLIQLSKKVKVPNTTLKFDVRDNLKVKTSINSLPLKFKKIDILINNAAIDAKYETDNTMNKSRLEDFDINQWNQEISVGLSGAFLCTKHFGLEMKKQKKGVILNISSDLGVIGPNQGLYEDDGISLDDDDDDGARQI